MKLCKIKFYNLCLFHSVQNNFLAQTGDPTGTGTSGGESIYRRLYGDQARYFEGDLVPKLKHNYRGNLSMVSAGDNMFGSQFFITLADNLESLDAGQHCIFGKIVEGLEILETLNETICDHDNRPYQGKYTNVYNCFTCHNVIGYARKFVPILSTFYRH